MDGSCRLLDHRQNRRVFPCSEPAIDSGGSRSRRIIRLGSSPGSAWSAGQGASHAASSTAAGNLRSCRHGGRPQQPAAPEDHRDRHEDVRGADEMAAIPKIRRPTAVHTTDQIVSMASRLGWTVGITADDLVGAQCRAVIGLAPQDEKWLAGENYVGVWHGTAEDAAQAAAGARRRAARPLRGAGGEPAGERAAQSAGHLSRLCDARPDDHPDQRPAIYRLQEVRMGRGRRNRLRRLLGPGAQDRRAQPVAAVLCRAPLWRRAGRGNADGAKTLASGQGHHRHEGAGQKRPALSRLRPMASRATCAPAWAFHTRRNRRHTPNNPVQASKTPQGIDHEVFVEIRHRCLWRQRFYRPARRRISGIALRAKTAI